MRGKNPLILSGNRWIFAACGISQLNWETCIALVNDTRTGLFLEKWLISIIVTTSAAIVFYHSLIFLLIFLFTLWGRCYLPGSTDKASGSGFICSLRQLVPQCLLRMVFRTPSVPCKAATEGWVNSWLLCPICSSKIKSLLIFIVSFTAWVLN